MGSEMCIRDRANLDATLISDLRPSDWRQAEWTKSSVHRAALLLLAAGDIGQAKRCLLYTSDAADERSSVDLGGRRIIKKKKMIKISDGLVLAHTRHNTAQKHTDTA